MLGGKRQREGESVEVEEGKCRRNGEDLAVKT